MEVRDIVIDILIVEDNKELAELLRDFLQAEGYMVSIAPTGEKALSLYERYGARLLVLDIMLPGLDGLGLCERIRKKSDVPILVVSARTAKEDMLKGLWSGADDYMEKPYDTDIMLAKIRGIFKRRYSLDELVCGNLRFNRITRTVWKDDVPVELTAKGFDLLLLLAENRGKALSKEYLFDRVWGSDSFSEQQTLTVHIKWIRQKIEDDPKNPQRILTVWGVGYQFV